MKFILKKFDNLVERSKFLALVVIFLFFFSLFFIIGFVYGVTERYGDDVLSNFIISYSKMAQYNNKTYLFFDCGEMRSTIMYNVETNDVEIIPFVDIIFEKETILEKVARHNIIIYALLGGSTGGFSLQTIVSNAKPTGKIVESIVAVASSISGLTLGYLISSKVSPSCKYFKLKKKLLDKKTWSEIERVVFHRKLYPFKDCGATIFNLIQELYGRMEHANIEKLPTNIKTMCIDNRSLSIRKFLGLHNVSTDFTDKSFKDLTHYINSCKKTVKYYSEMIFEHLPLEIEKYIDNISNKETRLRSNDYKSELYLNMWYDFYTKYEAPMIEISRVGLGYASKYVAEMRLNRVGLRLCED